MQKKVGLSYLDIIIVMICFILTSCGNYKASWYKTAGETTEQDWLVMTSYQKEGMVKGLIKTMEESGVKIVKTPDWFIASLDAFYKDGEANLNLAEAFSLIVIAGSTTDEQQKKIEKESGRISDFEERIWQFCMDRWDYYDNLDGDYTGDKYTDNVFNEAGLEFEITPEEAESIWLKVEKAKLVYPQIK